MVDNGQPFWQWSTMVRTMTLSWCLMVDHELTRLTIKNRGDHGRPWSAFRLGFMATVVEWLALSRS